MLTTLTTDAGRILSKLHEVTPNGESNFVTSIRIAHVSAYRSLARHPSSLPSLWTPEQMCPSLLPVTSV